MPSLSYISTGILAGTPMDIAVSTLLAKHARRAAGAVALLLGAFCAAAGASAAESGWQAAELAPGVAVEARLIAATDATGSLAAIPAGLHVVLPDGWKTYWRSPGDAGLPPSLDWTGSENLKDVRFDWPAPHRFTLFGLETFGYAEEVVFPLTLTPETPAQPMRLRARADLLVCSDICVPAAMTLALDLPAGAAAPDGDAANLIDRFASLVPGDGRVAGLAVEAADLVGADLLRVTAAADPALTAPDVFVEAGPGWAFGRPEIALRDGGRLLVADLPVVQSPSDGTSLESAPVTVTVVDGPRAMERTLAVGNAPAGGSSAPGLAAMIGLALLGGLVLNLMPCVLPVLSLKLLSVIGQGGRSRARIRLGFLASASGILVSFLALAGAAIAVKAAGGAVGWGIQFQQPVFVTAMIVVLTLFACNLLGFFEIPLPAGLADRAGRAGQSGTLAGEFATGAFATLLATPCSAPFLGTAVGFALARGPAEILVIFAALGIGLALPYLCIAAFPDLAARLPRPGRWMIAVKRVLSLALAAAALWLLSVLAVQEGRMAAVAVGVFMALIVLTLWVRRRLAGGARRAGAAAAALLAAAAFAAPLPLGGRPGAASGTDDPAADWAPFDRSRIDALVAEGRVVFVDVTADWCLTCKANKALVLDRGAVAERLGDGSVVPMRADWTRPDDGIAAYLADYGRYGIPFNAVYGPAAPEGVVLPEILTEAAVLNSLAQAAGPG